MAVKSRPAQTQILQDVIVVGVLTHRQPLALL